MLVSHLVTFLYTGDYADEYDSGTPDPTTYTPFVDLSDDDPVESKGHDAYANFISSSRMDAETKVADGRIADPEQSPDYSFDVKMYALSDQYDIPALGTLAKAKLEKAFMDHWNSKSFVEIVPPVYESTLESNQGLRTVVLTHARKHAGEFMQEGPLKSSFYGLLATTPEFGTALLSLYMSHSLPLPGKAGAGFGTEELGNDYNACERWGGRSWGFADAVDDLDPLGLRTGYELPELPYADRFGHID